MDNLTGMEVSRRGFVTGAVTLAGLTLAGCGGPSGSSGGSSGGTAKTALSVGMPTDISLPTLLRFQAANQPLRRTVFSYVLDKNPEGSYRPALAKSWELASDGKKMVIKLREDVTFHSGRAFGPDDVIASVRAATATGSGAQVAGLLKKASGMTKTGPAELTVLFDTPFASYLDGLSALPIIDSATYADLPSGKQVIGTGPFKWGTWAPGNSLQLQRNDTYFDGKPSLESVKFQVISDAQALLAAMRSDSINMAMRMLARDAATLAKDSRFSLVSGRGFEIYVGVNTSVKPLSDVRVRQAIAYAIDRKRISDQVFGGTAEPSAIPWASDTPGVTPAQASRYGYDVAKGKALLAEAGATGTEITISANPAEPTYVATKEIVQYGLEQVGFKVRNVAVDAAAFAANIQAGSFPGVWVADVALTALGQETTLLSANPLTAGKNTSNFTAPEYTTKVKALTDASGSGRATASADLTNYMLDQAFHNSIAQVHTPLIAVRGLSGAFLDLTLAVDLAKAKLMS